MLIISRKNIKDKYSSESALYVSKAENFEIPVCTATLYSYTEKETFLNLTNENLPSKKKKRENIKK